MRLHPRALLCALAASTALLWVGCGDSESDSDSAAPPAGEAEKAEKVAPKIALMLSLQNEYTVEYEKGFMEVIGSLGGEVQSFVHNFDPAKLTQQCSDAVASGKYNSMAISTIDPSFGVPCARVANAAGMPIIQMDGAIGKDANDLEPQVEGVVGGVIATPKENVATTLELVKVACEDFDPCKVIVEISSATDPLTNDVADAVDELPNADVVAKFETAYDPAEITRQLPDVLTANKDANVLVTLADSNALAAQPAIRDAGVQGKLVVTGNSGSREGVQLIKEGKMFGTTGSWPRQNAVFGAELLVKALNDEPIDPPVGIDSTQIDEPAVITKENVDEFKPEWGTR